MLREGRLVELLYAPVLAPLEGTSRPQGQPTGLLVAAAAALPGSSPLPCVALALLEAEARAGAARAADSTTIGTRPPRWPCSQCAAASSPLPAHLPQARKLAAGHMASSSHQHRRPRAAILDNPSMPVERGVNVIGMGCALPAGSHHHMAHTFVSVLTMHLGRMLLQQAPHLLPAQHNNLAVGMLEHKRHALGMQLARSSTSDMHFGQRARTRRSARSAGRPAARRSGARPGRARATAPSAAHCRSRASAAARCRAHSETVNCQQTTEAATLERNGGLRSRETRAGRFGAAWKEDGKGKGPRLERST